MYNINKNSYLPEAFARIIGSYKYPDISGIVEFSKVSEGVIVTAHIHGLPYVSSKCSYGIYGFHIHTGKSCTGNNTDPFSDSGGHYNPENCPHPFHSGDMPPLFGNKGYAYMSFLTNRFKIDDIIGRTVVIHISPDDFNTQPSGNSGEKIACGIIKAI